jgi:inner membrane protein
MENLTHTLVGLMMARCGLEKTTVRGAGMMMLAANAPDVDAVFWFNRLHYLDYHRSYTHSFAFAPLMALLPMVLVRAQFSWKSYAAAVAGVLSHLLLDWTNPYGIQLLLPFSHRRLMLDITNIADVWIWAILFVGLLAPLLTRVWRRNADSTRPEADLTRLSPRASWAWIALLSLLTYEGARFALHAKAVEMLESRMYDGAAPLQAIAVPADFVHPVLWKGIVRGAGFVTIVPLDVQDAYDASRERTWDDPPPNAAVEAARRLPDFQSMIRFSQAPFWETTPVSGGTLVELMDLRYGTPDDPGFAVVSSVVPNAVLGSTR